jgi:hypothetical protein
MLDFGKWFAQQGTQELEPAAQAEPDWPEGVWRQSDGKMVAECRSCGCSYELPCELSEFDQDMSYCGRSSHCLP